MTPAYALCFHSSLNSSETLRLTRISHVYTTERAQVAEGQDSKWPDESVTLGEISSLCLQRVKNVGWQFCSDSPNLER